MKKKDFALIARTGTGLAALPLLLALIIQGCAPAHLSKNYGRSYEAVLLAQTVNPDAPDDRNPPDLPGVVAEGIYNEYLNDIGTPPGTEKSERKKGEASEKKDSE